MSNHTIRHEKNCLNCGATVEERYCSHCGQENIQPTESFGHLIRHFFEDITHYDSHVFNSFKYLIARPGFLTRQYNAGKRACYLNPIRMYVFISAVFFLVFFSLNKEVENVKTITDAKGEVNLFRQHLADSLKGIYKTNKPVSAEDSIRNEVYNSIANRLDTIQSTPANGESLAIAFNSHGDLVLKMEETKFKSIGEYEKAQQKLPQSKKDDALDSYLSKKVIKLVVEQGSNGKAIITQSLEHDIPKIMFLLLPIFALFTGFFYSRKKFLYSQHAIFSLHFHSFLFLCFLVLCLVSLFNPSPRGWAAILLVFNAGFFVYLVAALHTAYQEAVLKSILKALGICLLYFISLVIINLVIMAIVVISI